MAIWSISIIVAAADIALALGLTVYVIRQAIRMCRPRVSAWRATMARRDDRADLGHVLNASH